MTHFTTRAKRRFPRLLAAAFWLALWQAFSMVIGQEILLVSPVSVCLSLLELAQTAAFWASAGFSFFKILSGFLLSVSTGVLLAAAGCRFPAVDILLHPALSLIHI